VLRDGIKLAENYITNENSVRYLLACVAAAILLSLAVWLPSVVLELHYENAPGYEAYSMAALAGAVGAVFSIALKIENLDLKPCAHSVMNYVMGALRVLIGFIAGATTLAFANGTNLGQGINSLFSSDLKQLSAESWKCIVRLGFAAGFIERLVPSFLKRLQSSLKDESPGAN
jgi:H+/Cl- antiporter ClcA